MKTDKYAISSRWLIIWACVLALGWLLPNHSYPWLSFHTDFWISSVFLIISFFIAAKIRLHTPISRVNLLVIALLLVPWIQWLLGLIFFVGTAWISFLYILGIAIAIAIGAAWESNKAGQPIDGLFTAIGIAAIVSVGLQLKQWLQMDGFWLLVMEGDSLRPFANLGQPNQLATLLLLGVLGAGWGWVRQYIGAAGALLMAMFLLFGVALTFSRTAWLGVLFLILASWHWRHLFPWKKSHWAISGLGLYFLICAFIINLINHNAISAGVGSAVASIPHINNAIYQGGGGVRLNGWAALLDGLTRSPWFGYGFNQSGIAQIVVALNHPNIQVLFRYAHNIILELLLWLGIPLGAIVFVLFARWLINSFRSINSIEAAFLMAFLLVVFNHSLFENPLWFAYIMLPVGVVIGVLDVRLGAEPVFYLRKSKLLAALGLGAIMLSIVFMDYMKIESSYQTLVLDRERIINSRDKTPPNIVLLTQWREYIQFARIDSYKNLTIERLNWMRRVALLYPDPGAFLKLAMALGLNGQEAESRLWLNRACGMFPESICIALKRMWLYEMGINPELKSVDWPEHVIE